LLAGNQNRDSRDVLTAVRRLMTLFARELTRAVVAAFKPETDKPSSEILKRDRMA